MSVGGSFVVWLIPTMFTFLFSTSVHVPWPILGNYFLNILKHISVESFILSGRYHILMLVKGKDASYKEQQIPNNFVYYRLRNVLTSSVFGQIKRKTRFIVLNSSAGLVWKSPWEPICNLFVKRPKILIQQF